MRFLYKSLIILFAMSLTTQAFAEQEIIKPTKVVNRDFVISSIAKYTNTITTNPKDEDGYINRAYLNYLIGNLDEAIADYNQLILIDPKNEEFYLNRGYLNHLAHKRLEALADYEQALKIKPNYTFALNNKGVVLAELGKNNEALSAYNEALKIDPNYADVYYNRGTLKTRTNNNTEALEDFNTAIKLNPSDSASFNNRGVVKRKLNYNVGALSDFSIAIRINPEDITALANRGRLKKRYYDSEGAEEDFKNAIAVAEESPILVKQVELEKQLATNPKATEETQKPTLREPKIATDNIQKISSKNLVKQDEENIKIAAVKASVVKMTPKPQETVLSQAPVNVAPEITTKPVANPKLAECYYIRALQKYILQNRESALKDFDLAIQHNPNYAEAYYYRAAIKRDFKDEGFVDDYKKALQLDPKLKAVDDANVLMILKM